MKGIKAYLFEVVVAFGRCVKAIELALFCKA